MVRALGPGKREPGELHFYSYLGAVIFLGGEVQARPAQGLHLQVHRWAGGRDCADPGHVP